MILEKTDPKTITILTSLMLEGKAAVIPCDTIYGLSAIYIKGETILREIKKRDSSKSFLILATKKQAEQLCADIPFDISSIWPCNLTTILNLKTGGTIAVRVPDDPFLQELLVKTGSPIYSTSVNTSGEPALLDFTSIKDKYQIIVSAIVKGNEVQGITPSTIVDATQRPYKLIRQGLFNAEQIISNSLK